jgi:hypothetical protein
MKDFAPVDWKEYNQPPFFPQWLSQDETLALALYDDPLLKDIDDQIMCIKDQYDLDTVKGILLDRIGKILGEPRHGNPDEMYRVLLRLRILLNTTNGTVNDVIKVIKFIYSSEEVHITPNYPAGISILHDGEGTQGLDFNRIISQVVGAGIAYDTKELFDFTENEDMDEAHRVKVKRKDLEYFGNPIKYNGAIKYDGHTLNPMIRAKGTYNGAFTHNGDLRYNGTGRLARPYDIKPPFKYNSGIVDILGVTYRAGDVSDTFPASDSIHLIRYNLAFSDAFTISEISQITAVRLEADEIKKPQTYNGRYKYNGKLLFSPWIEDQNKMAASTEAVSDSETMSEDFFVGRRTHHRFNGAYKHNGQIQYDSMALIPLG